MSTLLLADDSVTIRRVIELSFAGEDVDVVAVGTAQEALASLEAAPPDLILADLGLPDLDGYELTRRVKASPGRQAIPVLLLAGAFGPIDEEQVRACGAAGVFVKPFEPQALVTRVKELIAETPAARLPAFRSIPVQAAAAPVQRDPPAPEAPAAVGPAPAAPDAPDAPAAPVPRASLASIFATVLAAEQAAPAGESRAPAPVGPDPDVEAIVRQVLARVTDEWLHQVVRDATERLVREALQRRGTE